jgi:hypothetical protein
MLVIGFCADIVARGPTPAALHSLPLSFDCQPSFLSGTPGGDEERGQKEGCVVDAFASSSRHSPIAGSRIAAMVIEYQRTTALSRTGLPVVAACGARLARPPRRVRYSRPHTIARRRTGRTCASGA